MNQKTQKESFKAFICPARRKENQFMKTDQVADILRLASTGLHTIAITRCFF